VNFPKVRVMIVDDSAVVRRLLTQALSAHGEIEVVGSAQNGLIALNKLAGLNPEVIILDVEMPEMDGLTMLRHLRESHPRLPVIMFSTLTERGANVTFDALAAGASDYVLKPSTQTGETLDGVVKHSLVRKLLALTRSPFGMATLAAIKSLDGLDTRSTHRSGGLEELRPALPTPTPAAPPARTSGTNSPSLMVPRARTLPPTRPSSPAPAPLSSPSLRALVPPPVTRKPVRVVAIAVSTGGPNALADLVQRLPGNFPVPIVIVQHMPPIFTRCLADRLAVRAELQVSEAAGGELLRPGMVLIAPGNRHLELVRDGDTVRAQLSDGPPENSCRPAADVLFRSLLQSYGGAALCVVLTGMGQDGARGAREVQQAGGRVLAQSGPTCVVWGMPKAVEEAGIAEAIIPLPEMAAAILQRVGGGLLAPRRLEDER
jgi:two-component system, chemotaxis family, protein-glutamate methylesterase/glutaminase